MFFRKFFAAKIRSHRVLIRFKEYVEKKDKIALDISQLKKEISDNKVKSRLELRSISISLELNIGVLKTLVRVKIFRCRYYLEA